MRRFAHQLLCILLAAALGLSSLHAVAMTGHPMSHLTPAPELTSEPQSHAQHDCDYEAQTPHQHGVACSLDCANGCSSCHAPPAQALLVHTAHPASPTAQVSTSPRLIIAVHFRPPITRQA